MSLLRINWHFVQTFEKIRTRHHYPVVKDRCRGAMPSRRKVDTSDLPRQCQPLFLKNLLTTPQPQGSLNSPPAIAIEKPAPQLKTAVVVVAFFEPRVTRLLPRVRQVSHVLHGLQTVLGRHDHTQRRAVLES